ncbi:hypothetical protein QBC45DRAFT_426734 [Copromyces sp. CBS 386.78]|nr:hypothetical protein QBC45DRAFT_426734 [Copromyces sp. CBS 386.78]
MTERCARDIRSLPASTTRYHTHHTIPRSNPGPTAIPFPALSDRIPPPPGSHFRGTFGPWTFPLFALDHYPGGPNGISVYNIGLIYLRLSVEGFYRAKKKTLPYYYQTLWFSSTLGTFVHESTATSHSFTPPVAFPVPLPPWNPGSSGLPSA